jgi:NAD(P)-dependent dehydrogenase (short-subunit alcohol dehydrogenase family)
MLAMLHPRGALDNGVEPRHGQVSVWSEASWEELVMPGRVHGKVAIVTGAASGQGAATSRMLAREGARVLLADINSEGAQKVVHEIAALGGEAVARQVDVGSEAGVEEMVGAARQHFGRLDILHNNAALVSPEHLAADHLVTDIPVETWERTLAVNLRGPMLACKFAIPLMLEGGGGSIINTSSGAGFHGYPVRPAYGVSKGALHALTVSVAVEFGRQGIRCNTIVPGVVPGNRGLSEEYLAMRRRLSVTPFLGEPEDIAYLALYLASDESRYITGQKIAIDGGTSIATSEFAYLIEGGSTR